MDTSTPWYRKKADRPKVARTFRIYTDQLKVLEDEFNSDGSGLVRMLLEEAFRGDLKQLVLNVKAFRSKES